jgi:hypothetical protein
VNFTLESSIADFAGPVLKLDRKEDNFEDHLPHSVEYPASKAMVFVSRQVQLVCNNKYIEYRPKIIVVMERMMVDMLGALDFWGWRS